MLCFACNPMLVPSNEDVKNPMLFCGGDAICQCVNVDDNDVDVDLDRWHDDGGADDMTDSERWTWLNGYEDMLRDLPEMLIR